MNLIDTLQNADALVLVDVQNDFCPGGALPVTEGDRVVPALNRWIDAASGTRALVVASRDWHPVEHCSFQSQGGPWPQHCLQDTPGAAFHQDLALPPDAVLVSKGTAFDRDAYSAFDGTGLAVFLKKKGIKRLWVGGLAQDVCVLRTVVDACHLGFETHVLLSATRPVFPEKSALALAEMTAAGAILEQDDR